MSKNTSILLGEHFHQFIDRQIESGKFSSVSEVIRAALRTFEHEEAKKAQLIKELELGENSGFIENFDRDSFLKNIHSQQNLD